MSFSQIQVRLLTLHPHATQRAQMRCMPWPHQPKGWWSSYQQHPRSCNKTSPASRKWCTNNTCSQVMCSTTTQIYENQGMATTCTSSYYAKALRNDCMYSYQRYHLCMCMYVHTISRIVCTVTLYHTYIKHNSCTNYTMQNTCIYICVCRPIQPHWIRWRMWLQLKWSISMARLVIW